MSGRSLRSLKSQSSNVVPQTWSKPIRGSSIGRAIIGRAWPYQMPICFTVLCMILPSFRPIAEILRVKSNHAMTALQCMYLWISMCCIGSHSSFQWNIYRRKIVSYSIYITCTGKIYMYPSQLDVYLSKCYIYKCYRVCMYVLQSWRPDPRFTTSQWETALLCNAVSHWA